MTGKSLKMKITGEKKARHLGNRPKGNLPESLTNQKASMENPGIGG